MPRKTSSPRRKRKQPWYTEAAGFFGPRYLREYAPVLLPERTVREVDFVEKTLALAPGSAVLDLCCGHGRHAVELARRGFRVTGQDLNAFFLRKARAAAKEAGVKVRWRRRDMRHTDFEAEFDAVVNLFTAFGYFDGDAEDQAVIDRVARALRPGGRFLIDVMARDWIVRNFQSRGWSELEDGTVIVYERSFDPATSRNRERRIWIAPDGRRRESELLLRLYALHELVALCERAGLRRLAAFGDFQGTAYGLDARRCILVAEKP